MIVVAALDGRIIHTNTAVAHTLGYPVAELTAMHLADLYPAALRREAEDIFAAMVRGEQEQCSLPLACHNGLLLPVQTRVWQGMWNGAACLFGICQNLSGEQEANQRFERLFRHNPSL